jgi:hypothetical protein
MKFNNVDDHHCQPPVQILLSIFHPYGQLHILLGSDEEWETQVRWMFMDVRGKSLSSILWNFIHMGNFTIHVVNFDSQISYSFICVDSSICTIACMW